MRSVLFEGFRWLALPFVVSAVLEQITYFFTHNNKIIYHKSNVLSYLPINQPHKYIKEKNEAIKSIRERIQRGEYIGSKADDKGRKIVFHYITTTIAGEQSLIVLKENEERLLFYSITEKR